MKTDPKSSLPSRWLVHSLFEQQVACFPGRLALSLGEQQWTYAQLANRANEIARALVRRGVGPGDLVGVFLPRSFDLIAAFLGILKAGAAYVPLDLHYPKDRLDFMLLDTGVKVVLGVSDQRNALGLGDSRLVCLDRLEPVADAPVLPAEPGIAQAEGNRIAYVMYTSGSTGKPKGVAVPHRGIVRLVQEPDFVQITPDDVFLQASPVSFDASTLEIWGALTNGARLALLPPGQPSLVEIGAAIRRENVSILWLTAGLFNLMVDERLPDLAPVRQLLVGGDVLSVAHIRRALAGLPETQLINGYGPTENTTFTCCYSIPRQLGDVSSIPIGKAIHGTTVRLVDEQGHEVPDGEEGELVTGGLGLALGYWNRPELTAERFVQDPFSKDGSDRLYRTGDRARRLPDGIIEFLGRRDHQVKLRGFRIELGEIESALRQHSEVRDCVVRVWTEPTGNRVLAGWVVPWSRERLVSGSLHSYLESRLPDHMIPAVWMVVDEFPLNPSGKVDAARLPSPTAVWSEAPRELPKDELEQRIAQVWTELLGGRAVGVTQSFFELGASSLLLAQAHERLRQRIGFNFPLTDLFQFTTVRNLAAHLKDAQLPSKVDGAETAKRAQLRSAALNRFRRR